MSTISDAAIVFVIAELIALVIYYFVRKYFEKDEIGMPKHDNLLLSIFKGVLERLVIYVALISGISTVLVMFGALKIATRFDNKSKISNDYFLVGNFISVLIGVTAYTCYLNTLK